MKKKPKVKATAKGKIKPTKKSPKPREVRKPKGRKPRPAAPVEEPAPAPAPVDLGPVVLPSPEDSVRVLQKLAEVNDRALAAQKHYLELQGKTKNAKSKWEELAEEVQTLIRRSTHGSDLPLFDEIEREGDQRRMEDAAATPSANAEPATGTDG